MAAPNPDPASWSIGDVFDGRYRLEERVGRGGFGSVFRAIQLDTEREVALKILRPDLCDSDEAVKRFEREARLAQRLTHPNTVRLFDFGRARGQVPYLVLEYLRGESLYALIGRERALPGSRVARIAGQVLKSLMEAHAAGVVHRDIKPANIFLCAHAGVTDFVKLLDFGVAKSTSAQTMQTALTREGQFVGTAQYMAPEQVSGRPVGPATDVYALGLVMAEALTGVRVFDGTALEVCMKQMAPEPVPLAPTVLADPLGPVIRRATEKSVERRFATAAEMLAAIEPTAPSGPIHEPPTTNVSHPVQTRAAPLAPGQVPWVPHLAVPPAPDRSHLPLPAARRTGVGLAVGLAAGGLVVGAAVVGALWFGSTSGDAASPIAGSSAPSPGSVGAPGTTTPARVNEAALRRSAWLSSTLTGRDNEVASIRSVTMTPDQVVIKNQFSMTCGLRFGDDGRPAELVPRTPAGVSACIGPEGWRSKQPSIPLVCTEGGGRETCRGQYSLVSPQGFGDRATLELIRPLDGSGSNAPPTPTPPTNLPPQPTATSRPTSLPFPLPTPTPTSRPVPQKANDVF